MNEERRDQLTADVPTLNPRLVSVLLAFHKPFGVLSHFTPDGSRHRPLADFRFPPHVYPLGRLDAESEGLLLLSDEPDLTRGCFIPSRGHVRTYWAQVERVPSAEALRAARNGRRARRAPHPALPRLAA